MDILPELLLSKHTVQMNREQGLPGEILIDPLSSGIRDSHCFAIWALTWVATLTQGGKLKISAYRSHEGKVLLQYQYHPDGDSQTIDIEMCPPLGLLRQEWERQYATGKSVDQLKASFAEQVLERLPLAAVLRSMPNTVSAASERTQWIEKELTKKDLPLADEHGYATSEVCLIDLEVPGLLVNYGPRQQTPMLLQWIEWEQRSVPSAFGNPLSSAVTPPESLTVSVVEVSIDDLMDPSGLNEIEIEVAEAEDRLKNRFTNWGTECLGWYQPFHFYTDQCWGIYLNSAAIVDLGSVLRTQLSAVGCPKPGAACALAVRLVLAHEFFHARMEAFALGQEVLGQHPVFQPYSNVVYRGTLGTPQALEEAVANFVARRECQDLVSSWRDTAGWRQDAVSTVMVFIHSMFDLSPPGYRDWYLAGSSDTWRRLAAQAVSGRCDPPQPYPPIEPFLESLPGRSITLDDVPLWMTTEYSAPDKLFGVPTRREIERFLREKGYVPRHGKGSHEVWQAPDGRHFTLPVARTLSRLVFHSLLRHLSISKEDYLSARHAL